MKSLTPNPIQLEHFLKAVADYGLDPMDLLPVCSDVSGEETVTISRLGMSRTYSNASGWARAAIAELHRGTWGKGAGEPR